MDPVIDPMTKWARDRKENAAARDRQQAEEAVASTVMTATIIVMVAVVFLAFLMLGA
jgi:hypothetical protein